MSQPALKADGGEGCTRDLAQCSTHIDSERRVSEAIQSLDDAVRDLSHAGSKLASADASEVRRVAMGKYVLGNPSAWWHAWALPSEQFDSTTTSLASVLPTQSGRVWLLPETDGEAAAYDIDVADLDALLSACPYFEYYVIARDFTWLVAESDHNVFFRLSDAAVR